MTKYIDREEYCEKHCRCSNEYCDKESCPIWKAPPADVVPVVRCKDCVHARKKNDYESAYLCYGVLICTSCEASEDGWLPVWPQHFCSYGCPRDGDSDAEAD